MFTLPEDRMPEAEVALRLAFHLVALPGSSRRALVAIDGAQVTVSDNEVFPIVGFLEAEGWKQLGQKGKNPWQGAYEKDNIQIDLRAESGLGDVVCKVGAATVRAECKKGPLVKKKGSREYPLLREALGQVLTIETVADSDHLVVAVPRTSAFRALVERWRDRPLVRSARIHLVLVGRDGVVEGLNLGELG